jgi:hypothetical protein
VVVAPAQVQPAIGAIYYSVPYGAQPMTIRGQQYYFLGGAYYQPFFGGNGVYYQVVPQPI